MNSKTLPFFIVAIFSGAFGAVIATNITLNSLKTEPASVKQDIAVSEAQQESTASLAQVSQEDQVVAVVDDASPAVVSIIVSEEVDVTETVIENPFGDFFPFFEQPVERPTGETEEREIGGGSGFLVSNDGLIVTNKHVARRDGVTYTAFLANGDSYEATVLARDPFNDLAVLKIEGSDFPYLEFADSDSVKVGQTVVAIGNALSEFQNSVSVGIISGLSRSITAGDGFGESELLEDVIQTDAAINPGNSGGPLLNLDGKVVGVNVAVSRNSENIGFALPGNLARDVSKSVSETGRIVRPYIGVRYMMVTDKLQELNNLAVNHGALLVRGDTPQELAVFPGSPADDAGLEENDIILDIDGIELNQDTSLASIIRKKSVGDRIELRVLRGDDEFTTTVILEELETEL